LKRLVRIFGGAIRDIIAEQQINDVDILVGAQSSRLVELTLKEQGYTYMESLTPKRPFFYL
jgi:tRNA nucleotidyltransferase/poly(A) polymerase